MYYLLARVALLPPLRIIQIRVALRMPYTVFLVKLLLAHKALSGNNVSLFAGVPEEVPEVFLHRAA